MKGAFAIKKYAINHGNSRYAAAALSGAALTYTNKDVREKIRAIVAGPLTSNECASSAEEQAADLEKIFKESGGMISQEELMEMVMAKKSAL